MSTKRDERERDLDNCTLPRLTWREALEVASAVGAVGVLLVMLAVALGL